MTNELYDVLYNNIKTITPNVFRNKAKAGVYPYCVIRIDTMVDTYPTLDYSAIITFFDKDGKSIKPLEIMADETVDLLNNKVLSSENQYYHSTLSLRQFINSEYLVGTQAIELQFLIKIYRKDV